jgi:hypothetical protein
MVNAISRTLYTRERAPVSIIREAGWAPEPVSMGMEKRIFLAIIEFEPRTVQPVANRYTD